MLVRLVLCNFIEYFKDFAAYPRFIWKLFRVTYVAPFCPKRKCGKAKWSGREGQGKGCEGYTRIRACKKIRLPFLSSCTRSHSHSPYCWVSFQVFMALSSLFVCMATECQRISVWHCVCLSVFVSFEYIVNERFACEFVVIVAFALYIL